MRIKLDENLPRALVPELSQLGHDVQTVNDEGQVGEPDTRIWDVCQSERRFLVTQDLDFSDIRRFVPGTHEGILLVRLKRPGRSALFERVLAIFQTEAAATWQGCFVTATEHRVRVRRPR
jgi:predicted nuclease of predicted toxin-antitoxin system